MRVILSQELHYSYNPVIGDENSVKFAFMNRPENICSRVEGFIWIFRLAIGMLVLGSFSELEGTFGRGEKSLELLMSKEMSSLHYARWKFSEAIRMQQSAPSIYLLPRGWISCGGIRVPEKSCAIVYRYIVENAIPAAVEGLLGKGFNINMPVQKCQNVRKASDTIHSDWFKKFYPQFLQFHNLNPAELKAADVTHFLKKIKNIRKLVFGPAVFCGITAAARMSEVSNGKIYDGPDGDSNYNIAFQNGNFFIYEHSSSYVKQSHAFKMHHERTRLIAPGASHWIHICCSLLIPLGQMLLLAVGIQGDLNYRDFWGQYGYGNGDESSAEQLRHALKVLCKESLNVDGYSCWHMRHHKKLAARECTEVMATEDAQEIIRKTFNSQFGHSSADLRYGNVAGLHAGATSSSASLEVLTSLSFFVKVLEYDEEYLNSSVVASMATSNDRIVAKRATRVMKSSIMVNGRKSSLSIKVPSTSSVISELKSSSTTLNV